jgi:hypothetical protein
MPRIYGYVRPYPGRLGKQVRDFVEEQGFVLGPGMVVAAGATDTYASRWILRATMDLLVLPFHLHRGDGGQVLDAIGVLMSLPEDVDLGGLPVLMPVRAFSWGSSFQRRLDLLRDTRPHVARQLIIAHQDEIGSPTLASRLRRLCARPPSTAPLVRSQSMMPEPFPGMATLPPTMRHPPPFWNDHPLLDQGDSAWPERNPSSRPASSRPSGTRPTRPPIDLPGDDWVSAPSEPTLSEPVLSKPILSRPILSEPSASEPAVSGARAKRGTFEESERTSMVLPKSPARVDGEPDSAQDRFRRAAEIGQQARKDASTRKKER